MRTTRRPASGRKSDLGRAWSGWEGDERAFWNVSTGPLNVSEGARGNKTRETDSLGRTTIYNYDANGIDLLSVQQVNGQNVDTLSSTTYNAQHQPLTATDAAGETTTYTYTPSGQIETVTTPPRAGIAEDRTTTYTYDPVTGTRSGVLGPGGVTMSSSTYDPYGRVRTTTDADGYTLTYEYDVLDRVTKKTYPDGTYDETIYNRLDAEQHRDRLGRWTHTFYDALQRPTATRDAEGRTTIKAEWVDCGGGCTGGSKVSTLTDARGNTTTWEYDLEGRKVKETRADGAFKTWTYENTTSRLKQVIDAKLQEVHYIYALDDKLLSTTHVNAAHPTPDVTVSYTDPQTGQPDAHGRLRSMTDGTGTTTYAYLPFGQLGAGQLASVDGPLPDDTISYTYDELGRVKTRTLNGSTTSWSYDTLGRTTTQTTPIGSFGWSYVDNTGRVGTLTYPNGQTTSYSYLPVDQELRLQQIHNKRPDGGTLSKFDYTYDVVGNIRTWAQQADASAPQVYGFDYDRTDQLSEATLTDPATQQVLKRYRYVYDPAGNRTVEQIDDASTLSVYDNMNRLTTQQPGGGLVFRGTVSEPATVTVAGKPATVTASGVFTGTAQVAAGTTTVEVKATDPAGNARTNLYEITVSGPSKSFSYDSNGNLTSDGTRNFEWDAENRLITVKEAGSTTASFVYDGNGRRVSKTAGNLIQTFVYDGTQFAEERLSTGTTYRYYYAPGIDQPLARGDQAGTVAYFTRDHLGSIAERTDAAGGVSARRRYDPWGDLLPGSSTEPGFAFTGREWDSETDLYYYRARYYSSKLGRFVSEDPAGSAGGLNLFRYVDNNPVNSLDPLGLAKLCCRPAHGWWTFGGCHCFVELCDGTTLGSYREKILLTAHRNFPDDWPVRAPSSCVDLGLTKAEEKDINRRFDVLAATEYPVIYLVFGTSNRLPQSLLRPYGIRLPFCAYGAELD